MQMTEKEICKEYREAKNPNHQIKILAQLNCTSIENVVEILKANNEPLRKRPYNRKAESVKINDKPQKVSYTKPVDEEKPKTAKKAIPAAVDEALRDKIKALQAINAISQQRIDEQMEIISKNNESIKQIRAYLTMEG